MLYLIDGVKLYPQRTSLCDHECTFCILFVLLLRVTKERNKNVKKKLKDKTERKEGREEESEAGEWNSLQMES